MWMIITRLGHEVVVQHLAVVALLLVACRSTDFTVDNTAAHSWEIRGGSWVDGISVDGVTYGGPGGSMARPKTWTSATSSSMGTLSWRTRQ